MKNMMNTIIKFIKMNYNEIKIIELTDNSNVKCLSRLTNKNYNINLFKLYFLKYKSGYYQYNFGFELNDNYYKDMLKNNINKYNNYVFNIEKFISYIEKYNISLNIIRNNLNKFVDVINNDVKNVNNTNQFILTSNKISKQLKNKYDCFFLELIINFIFEDCNLIDLLGKNYIKKPF